MNWVVSSGLHLRLPVTKTHFQGIRVRGGCDFRCRQVNLQLVGERGNEHSHSTEGGVGLERCCSYFLFGHLSYYDKEQVFLQCFFPSLDSGQPWDGHCQCQCIQWGTRDHVVESGASNLWNALLTASWKQILRRETNEVESKILSSPQRLVLQKPLKTQFRTSSP